MVGWLRSLFFPIKRLWGRLHSGRRKRRGLYILYEDVKSCSCEDVHALWSMLVDSDAALSPYQLQLKPAEMGDQAGMASVV